MNKICLCDSGKPFSQCCDRYLSEGLIASTPKQLMRSRYTAYALGNHGDYLIETWLPEKSKGMIAETLSEKNLEWVKLEILDNSQKGNEGMVEFNAYYKTENGELNVLNEKSNFRRINRRWYYVDGEVNNSAG